MSEVVVAVERMVVRGGDEDVGVDDVVVNVGDEDGEEKIRVIRRDEEMAGVGDRPWGARWRCLYWWWPLVESKGE